MRKLLRYFPIACAVFFAGYGGSAWAQEPNSGPSALSGLYFDLGLGGAALGDGDITGGSINTQAAFKTGYGVRAAVGKSYGNGWRTEVEVGYRSNGIDKIGGSAGSGRAKVLSGMVNGYYDFDTDSALTPYVGVGVGAVRVSADGYSPVSSTSIDDSSIEFGYQGIAGVSWGFADALALTADYRYLATTDPSFTTASGTSVDGEYRSQALMIGLRYSFGDTSPANRIATEKSDRNMTAAEPFQESAQSSGGGTATAEGTASTEDTVGVSAAAETGLNEQMAASSSQSATSKAIPSVPRDYRVLFDLDSADLGGTARSVVDEIAANAITGEIIRIKAVGHTDTSGSASYNMTLSKERAETVKAALIARGIPADQIVIDWKGETDPLVPTADGVYEPRDRRVEVTFPK